MLYSEKVMDHFTNPRNVGEIEDANGVGEVGNAKCGDIMKMYLKIENGVIEDVKFKTFGWGAATATSSMATEMIKGKTVQEALKLTNSAVVEALEGLPPVKIHCSVLAEQAIKTALADYYTRQGIDPTPFVGELKDPDEEHLTCEMKQNSGGPLRRRGFFRLRLPDETAGIRCNRIGFASLPRSQQHCRSGAGRCGRHGHSADRSAGGRMVPARSSCPLG